MKQLIAADKAFFKLLNGQLTNRFFDWLMPWLRNPPVWAPLYLFIALMLLINLKKKGLAILVFAIVTVSFTDSISHAFKILFNRLRPCTDPAMEGMVRLLLDYAPANGSFTSSHASNHFGIAVFLHLTLHRYFGWYTWLLFIWAFFICYAQVYVGIHYPGDVLGGALIGCLVGYLTAFFCNMLTASTAFKAWQKGTR